MISTIAGTGTASYSGDGGPATSAAVSCPTGIAVDSSGNVYFNAFFNHRVRKITSSTGIISTYAGTGSTSYSGDNGVASSAALYNPDGLCMDSSGNAASNMHTSLSTFLLKSLCLLGNLYIAEWGNHRVRKVMITTSVISTIAGTGASSYSGDDRAASSAALYKPVGVALDTSGTYKLVLRLHSDSLLVILIGNVYIGDWGNNRVRKITASTSIITTIAGTGTEGFSGDGGAATAAAIAYPTGINLDSAGNVYFGGAAYNVVRKITVSSGMISTVAGNGGTGYSGDNIQATAATFNCPHDIVLDSNDNLYISDRFNNRVRKVDVSTGIITTIIGNGAASSTGDGSAATSASVTGPCFSRFDSSGNYYVSECDGQRVRKVVTITTDIPTATPTAAAPTR